MSKTLLLFDVDGTLTLPRLKINDNMLDVLKNTKQTNIFELGFVGGSDLNKQIEQLGEENMSLFTWKFAENGLMAYYENELIHQQSLIEHLGETNYQNLINACLQVLSETTVPVKRGNFIELRNGMINISPIGRSCNQNERDYFYEWDKTEKCREKIIEILKIKLNDLNLSYSIGGQISIDIFPKGWDKTYCLPFLENKYKQIIFFGDKTEKGGNDYEIYNDSRVKSYNVTSYFDTISIINNNYM